MLTILSDSDWLLFSSAGNPSSAVSSYSLGWLIGISHLRLLEFLPNTKDFGMDVDLHSLGYIWQSTTILTLAGNLLIQVATDQSSNETESLLVL